MRNPEEHVDQKVDDPRPNYHPKKRVKHMASFAVQPAQAFPENWHPDPVGLSVRPVFPHIRH